MKEDGKMVEDRKMKEGGNKMQNGADQSQRDMGRWIQGKIIEKNEEEEEEAGRRIMTMQDHHITMVYQHHGHQWERKTNYRKRTEEKMTG